MVAKFLAIKSSACDPCGGPNLVINYVLYLVGHSVMKFVVNLVNYLVTMFGGPKLVAHLVGHWVIKSVGHLVCQS